MCTVETLSFLHCVGEVFAESVLRDIRAFEQALRSLEGAEGQHPMQRMDNQRREGTSNGDDGKNTRFSWCFVECFFWRKKMFNKKRLFLEVEEKLFFPEMEGGG